MGVVEEALNARSRRTRAAVLDAARAIVEAEGFPALTMGRVAERAGVSRRALYLHVASRTELVTALFAHVNEETGLEESVRRVWEAPDAAAALDEWAGHVARVHPQVAASLRAVDQVRRTDPDAERLWQLTMRDWYAGCLRLARWLDREGRLAEPWTTRTVADMLWTLMSYDVVERLVVERRWSTARLAEHLAALMRRTFLG